MYHLKGLSLLTKTPCAKTESERPVILVTIAGSLVHVLTQSVVYIRRHSYPSVDR